MELQEMLDQVIHLVERIKVKIKADEEAGKVAPKLSPLQPEPARRVFQLGQSVPKSPVIDTSEAQAETHQQQHLDYDAAQRERAKRIITEENVPDVATLKHVVQRSSTIQEGSLEHVVYESVAKRPGMSTQQVQDKLKKHYHHTAVYRALRDLRLSNKLRTQGLRPMHWYTC